MSQLSCGPGALSPPDERFGVGQVANPTSDWVVPGSRCCASSSARRLLWVLFPIYALAAEIYLYLPSVQARLVDWG